jgi:hypothetical protein
MRGGARDPLSQRELHEKFVDNALFGGWSVGGAAAFEDLLPEIFALPRLDRVKDFRS